MKPRVLLINVLVCVQNKRINLTLLYGERQKWGTREVGLLPTSAA